MKAFLTTAFVIGTFNLFATVYPISPMPLRKLIIESEYIVIGHVTAIEEIKGQKESFDDNMVAHIRVVEVLQGRIKDTTIQVSFNPHYICPAPAIYKENTDVIAFLRKTKKGFETQSLSYGSKTMSLENIQIYKKRIVEMKQILALDNEDERFIQTVEWLVKCAEHEATQWEGVFELSPESDFMSYYSRSEPQPFQYMLSKEQKARLKKALFDTRSGYVSFGIVDLIYSEYEAEVYPYLVQSLKSISDDALFIADEYMIRIMRRQSKGDLEKLLKEFEAIRFDYEKTSEQRKIVDQFVALAKE